MPDVCTVRVYHVICSLLELLISFKNLRWPWRAPLRFRLLFFLTTSFWLYFFCWEWISGCCVLFSLVLLSWLQALNSFFRCQTGVADRRSQANPEDQRWQLVKVGYQTIKRQVKFKIYIHCENKQSYHGQVQRGGEKIHAGFWLLA